MENSQDSQEKLENSLDHKAINNNQGDNQLDSSNSNIENKTTELEDNQQATLSSNQPKIGSDESNKIIEKNETTQNAEEASKVQIEQGYQSFTQTQQMPNLVQPPQNHGQPQQVRPNVPPYPNQGYQNQGSQVPYPPQPQQVRPNVTPYPNQGNQVPYPNQGYQNQGSQVPYPPQPQQVRPNVSPYPNQVNQAPYPNQGYQNQGRPVPYQPQQQQVRPNVSPYPNQVNQVPYPNQGYQNQGYQNQGRQVPYPPQPQQVRPNVPPYPNQGNQVPYQNQGYQNQGRQVPYPPQPQQVRPNNQGFNTTPNFNNPQQMGYYQPPAKPEKTKKDFEQQFGGKITNIIGISFMLLAVIFGLYYTYTILESNIVKSIIAYAVGILFIGVCEVFNRKSQSGKNYFSVGLCAGGVSILFATTAISYFELNVFSVPVAFAACAIVFLISMFLALRYDSELIGIFAVIGGFMPTLALEPSLTITVVSMCYFLILNLFVLILADKKNWSVIKFFSLILNLSCSIYIYNEVGTSPVLLVAGYFLLNWLLYLAVILIRPLKTEQSLKVRDIVLTAINSFVSFILLFLVIHKELGNKSDWISGALFAIVFFAISFLWKKFIPKDRNAFNFFFISACLALLQGTIVRFSDGNLFFALAVEGMALMICGVVSKEKLYKFTGGLFTGMGLFGFYSIYVSSVISMNDFNYNPFKPELQVVIKFLILTLGLGAVLLTMKIVNKSVKNYFGVKQSNAVEITKTVGLGNLWIFLIYVTYFAFMQFSDNLANFWIKYVVCFITMLLILLVEKSSIYKSVTSNILVIIQGVYAACYLAFFINFSSIVKLYEQNTGLKIATVAAVCIINVLGIFTLYSLMDQLIKNTESKKNVIPVTISLTSLFLAYSVCRHHILGSKSILLSVLILLWALGMIIYGFIKNLKVVRLTGLGLSIIVVFKIFVLDLSFLYGWQRALSYAAVGLIFIIISFAYQHFSGKIRSQQVVASGSQMNNNIQGSITQPQAVGTQQAYQQGDQVATQTLNHSETPVQPADIIQESVSEIETDTEPVVDEEDFEKFEQEIKKAEENKEGLFEEVETEETTLKSEILDTEKVPVKEDSDNQTKKDEKTAKPKED